MQNRWRVPAMLLFVFVLLAGSAYGQHIFQMRAYSLPIQVLSQEDFESKVGDNPHIPRTNREIIALAETLYPSLAIKAQDAAQAVETEDWCGEKHVGFLFAALRNPAISDVTRTMVDDIIAAAIPPLPKSKISASGHFKIFYTGDNTDKRHNVTDTQIDDLAAQLDTWWDAYVVNFKEPQHKLVDKVKRIDVKVYYIDDSTLGQTSSDWDHIEFNSKRCVRDYCQRRTTSAHELFHRVQYAYGYISGATGMGWMSEGTAVWAQKFTNQRIRDYMGRMNSGLDSPNDPLLRRDYDAGHFWVYLQEHAGIPALAQVWAKYEANGQKAKEAVGSVTSDLLNLTFDQFAAKWSKANYMKDLANAKRGGYDYDENAVTKTSCGVTHGPLDMVPVKARLIDPDSNFMWEWSVKPYAADYYVFTLGDTLKDLAVSFEGTGGSFALSFIGIKDNQWKSITNKGLTKYNFTKSLAGGEWDKLAVMVMGKAKGGDYTITAGGCIAGTWLCYGTWELRENGTAITGAMKHATCGTVNVTGTYNKPNIVLNTDIVVPGCCSVKWEGTVTDCQSISGTWTRTGGGSPCVGSGIFKMTKQTSDSAESRVAIESEEDPLCGTCNPNSPKGP